MRNVERARHNECYERNEERKAKNDRKAREVNEKKGSRVSSRKEAERIGQSLNCLTHSGMERLPTER